ncbi:hypothetical protein FHR83_003124 [Actinoplanes campanulatus]|uniref:Uncharacterized protein n=1 Tax=Actinoplanes campanulatus TaxID=113559 RepID=A0A7W5FEH1_9ACTN|nr:hypothetical protein [Actinoplanes campanulatus]GGN09118.1 hypothetical protein GCM10010109_18220 [Actinoplanes campanulatus]GID36340.1 hypothetical protein Aca09nite_28460 [Actinoplanes campanulatus]
MVPARGPVDSGRCALGHRWKALTFLRADYAAKGETATLRRVSVVGGIPVKELFALFPQKPAKKMAYIAAPATTRNAMTTVSHSMDGCGSRRRQGR